MKWRELVGGLCLCFGGCISLQERFSVGSFGRSASPHPDSNLVVSGPTEIRTRVLRFKYHYLNSNIPRSTAAAMELVGIEACLPNNCLWVQPKCFPPPKCRLHTKYPFAIAGPKQIRLQHKGIFRAGQYVYAAAQVEEHWDEELIGRLLKDLSDSLLLPPKFLKTLPKDLQVDVKDAAFALSKGPVEQECGGQVGNLLQRLSRAWEQADTEATAEIGKAFVSLQGAISRSAGPAFGRRLINAGRYLKSTGQYAQGEIQNIAKALVALGEAVGGKEAPPQNLYDSPRVLKFGSLQVAITPRGAFSGAAIAFVFGILSWQLASSVQNVPESSLNYANDNAFIIGASLRGTLLAMGYSCAGLSAFCMIGLLVLGFQLSGEDK